MHYFPEIDESQIAERLVAWNAAFPGMAVLVLLPEAEKNRAALLQNICRLRDIPLMGGIFPALIVENRFCSTGCWLLRFDEAPFFRIFDGLGPDIGTALQKADEMAEDVQAQIGKAAEEMTLLLLFDAMVPNIASMLDELYLTLANRVHYVGANAGSETFKPMPCLFDSQRIVGNAVLAMLIRNHRGAVLEHGYQLPQRSHIATSTDGNRISHIDWKPAFEVYCQFARDQYGVEITRENFYRLAVHFPFGIVRANHNVLVRIPVALTDDGSLFCVGEVPPHSMLSLLEAPEPDSRHTVHALMEKLARLNGGLSERDLLLFYCAGRRMHLGAPAAEAEIPDLQRQSRVKQIAGALPLGEIGAFSLRGYPLFHNATLVAALW